MDTLTGYDNAASAGLFSQFSGVMAGVVITILVLILALYHEEGERLERDAIASTLIVSFIGFVLATLGYAAIGSEKPAEGQAISPRGASETILADVDLAIAFTRFALGLFLLMRGMRLSESIVLSRWLMGLAIPALAYAYILGDVVRYFTYASGLMYIGGGAVALLVPLLLLRRRWPSVAHLRMLNRFGYGGAIVCAGLEGVVQAQNPNFSLSPAIVFPLVAGLLVLLATNALIALHVPRG